MEEAKTEEQSEIVTQKKGMFSLIGSLGPSIDPHAKPLQFKFNFADVKPIKLVAEESKESNLSGAVPPNFIRSMKLEDEKKFFVQKNLFEPNSKNKLLASLPEGLKTPKKEELKTEAKPALV